MKTSRLLILVATAALSLTACRKEYITENIIEGNEMYTTDPITVKANQWTVDEDGGYFTVTLSVSAITRDVVDNGTIQVLRRLTDNSGNIYWTPLPVVRANEEVSDDGEVFNYSTYIDYEWGVGEVNIFVTATDFYTGENPGDMVFRVVIFC